MADYVTLEQASAHLRAGIEIDSPLDGEAADLELKLDAAERIILDYLKVTDELEESPVWDPGADLPIVQQAILIILSALWDDREGTGIGDYLKPDGAVARLLMRLRDPAIA